jgi:hypothetical protein
MVEGLAEARGAPAGRSMMIARRGARSLPSSSLPVRRSPKSSRWSGLLSSEGNRPLVSRRISRNDYCYSHLMVSVTVTKKKR